MKKSISIALMLLLRLGALNAQDDRIIINEHLSIVYFQKDNGQRVEPYLYKNEVSELFVEVSAMNEICDLEIELWNSQNQEVEILRRFSRNGVVGVTFNTLDQPYLDLRIFSNCREVVTLNTVQGLINLSGRKKIGGALLAIH